MLSSDESNGSGSLCCAGAVESNNSSPEHEMYSNTCLNFQELCKRMLAVYITISKSAQGVSLIQHDSCSNIAQPSTMEAVTASTMNNKPEAAKNETSPPNSAASSSSLLPKTQFNMKPYVSKTAAQYTQAQQSSRAQQSAAGGFKYILYIYLDRPLENYEFILGETRDCVVVYDAYPKAAVHLLVLPKRHFLNGVLTCDDMQPKHLEQLKEMHRVARYVAQSENVRACLRSKAKHFSTSKYETFSLEYLQSRAESPVKKLHNES